ncbi:GNAT family N-acetyltransferase [Dongia sedimenti]|uniref:GNAT family N-acetyltransferase n=1 Tax=Dongia sedimenti TaxID=3064282 RepID=A0ABU0YRR2_9PROT|nr:GNAT family N-acetyltransferase [Rhodospirillaceae bacterium R-7]
MSWWHAYEGIIPHGALTLMIGRRSIVWWRRLVHRSVPVLVADFSGEIVGYAAFGANRSRCLPQQGEVYELYLRPEYQGVGIGRELFAEARHCLKSLRLSGLVTWCLEGSEASGRFLRTQGGVDAVEGYETFGEARLKKIGFVWS